MAKAKQFVHYLQIAVPFINLALSFLPGKSKEAVAVKYAMAVIDAVSQGADIPFPPAELIKRQGAAG